MPPVSASVSVEMCDRAIDPTGSGLTEVLSELIAALEKLPETQHSDQRLQELERETARSTTPADLQRVKDGIREHLARSRKEALQQRRELSELISGVIAGVRASQERMRRMAGRNSTLPGSTDPLTGLPARSYAETELSRIQAQGTERHVAMFVVKRLQYINARLGFSRGDQILLRVAQYLAQALPDFGNLMRWTGCSFLTIAPEATSYLDLRQKVQTITLQRLAPTLEWEGHTALIPVTLDWQIVALGEFESPDALFLRLDAFASET